jgi:Flp pilus assembly protein CpaB
MALTKIVVNCETGVTEEVELTPAEIAQLEADQAQGLIDLAAREAADTAKATAKASAQAKLTALGLTEAEVAALLG